MKASFSSFFVLVSICVVGVHADVMLDNFNQGSASILVNDGSTSASYTNTGLNVTNTIGGERYASLIWELGTENTTLIINGAGDTAGNSSYGSQPSNNGYYDLIYGRSADLGADLTQGGTNNRIGILFTFSDVVGTAVVTVVDSGLNSDSHAMSMPIGGEQSTWVYFDYINYSGVDFTDVDQVTVRIDGTSGSDSEIDYIATTFIPEPTTTVLLCLGVCGIFFCRRSLRRSND